VRSDDPNYDISINSRTEVRKILRDEKFMSTIPRHKKVTAEREKKEMEAWKSSSVEINSLPRHLSTLAVWISFPLAISPKSFTQLVWLLLMSEYWLPLTFWLKPECAKKINAWLPHSNYSRSMKDLFLAFCKTSKDLRREIC